MQIKTEKNAVFKPLQKNQTSNTLSNIDKILHIFWKPVKS